MLTPPTFKSNWLTALVMFPWWYVGRFIKGPIIVGAFDLYVPRWLTLSIKRVAIETGDCRCVFVNWRIGANWLLLTVKLVLWGTNYTCFFWFSSIALIRHCRGVIKGGSGVHKSKKSLLFDDKQKSFWATTYLNFIKFGRKLSELLANSTYALLAQKLHTPFLHKSYICPSCAKIYIRPSCAKIYIRPSCTKITYALLALKFYIRPFCTKIARSA